MKVTLCVLLVPSVAALTLQVATARQHASLACPLRIAGGARMSDEDTLTEEQLLERPIPVTLLSGFLGAGKTTLLRHLLQNTEGVRIGVVVNDVAAVNVDAKLVQTGAGQGMGDGLPEDFIELSNGCACCSAGDDLFGALAELVSSSFMRGVRYDHIVFEASGVSEPKLLRAMFQEASGQGWPLMRCIRLENMVTVVDSSSFLDLYSSTDRISDREDLGADAEDAAQTDAWGIAPIEEPSLSVVQLLIEQVETADVRGGVQPAPLSP